MGVAFLPSHDVYTGNGGRVSQRCRAYERLSHLVRPMIANPYPLCVKSKMDITTSMTMSKIMIHSKREE